jgi:hypothetical protein
MTMHSGYCFALETADPWNISDDEVWAIEIYAPIARERFMGRRRIDGTVCSVWECPDGRFRAQVSHVVSATNV